MIDGDGANSRMLLKAEAGIGGRAGPYRLDVGQELVMLTEAWKIETYVSTKGKYFEICLVIFPYASQNQTQTLKLTHHRSANRSYCDILCYKNHPRKQHPRKSRRRRSLRSGTKRHNRWQMRLMLIASRSCR